MSVAKVARKLGLRRTMTPNQIVAYNVAKARELRGWTQEQAAEALGLVPRGEALGRQLLRPRTEAAVCGRTIPEFRARLEWDDVVDALIEPEEGLCAHRTRFNEAHVVEHIAALGAGRLTVETIEDLAEAFIDSEHTVALTDRTGRTSPRY